MVRIGAEKSCFLYKVQNGNLIKGEDPELCCPTHGEACSLTKMLVHVASVPCLATVVVRLPTHTSW